MRAWRIGLPLLAACEGVSAGPDPSVALGVPPCAARVDALLATGDTLWLGCGQAAAGSTLARSDDGGRTWAGVDTPDAPGFFDEARVNDLVAYGERVLVAGDLGDGVRAVALDPATGGLEVVLHRDDLGQGWAVGSVAALADGALVAESLTGVDLAVRPPGGAWEEVSATAWGEGGRRNVHRLTTWAGALYGAGATGTLPPMVLVPPDDGEGLFAPVELAGAGVVPVTGELFDVAVDDAGAVAAGYAQGDDVGLVASIGGEGWSARRAEPEAWTVTRLDDVLPGGPTVVRGVCRDGARVVAVGGWWDRTDEGFVVRSDDGGARFEVVEDAGIPHLWRCAATDDGFVVAGGGWLSALR